VSAASLLDVIDLEPIGRAQASVLWIPARRRLVTAPRTAVPVAAFRGATRQRPPMIVPEMIGASLAAPHSAAGRQRIAAPTALSVRACDQRTVSD